MLFRCVWSSYHPWGRSRSRWTSVCSPRCRCSSCWHHLSNLTGQTGSPLLTNEAVKRSESVHSWELSLWSPPANLGLFILFFIPSGAIACCLHCGNHNNPEKADPRGQWWHVVADASSCKAFLSDRDWGLACYFFFLLRLFSYVYLSKTFYPFYWITLISLVSLLLFCSCHFPPFFFPTSFHPSCLSLILLPDFMSFSYFSPLLQSVNHLKVTFKHCPTTTV